MNSQKTLKSKPEIERKFLLKNIPVFGKNKWTYLDIRQFYFMINGERIRYRESIDENNKTTYYYTKKKFISAGINDELEYEITKREFWKTFKSSKNKSIIEKTRFIYKYKGFKFEIDKYVDMKLVVMEVELKNIKQKIPFPPFIKKEIIVEVTNIKEFGNFNLSKKL